MKSILYWLFYLKNIWNYSRKKVHLNFLELWVGQSCTLKCRDCLHMIPYVRAELYDVEELIRDLKHLFWLCQVDYISVLGGEPLTNRKLYRLIDFISSCPQIREGKLITNGTILPDERLIRSLVRLNGKLDVRIDSYPGSEEKALHFYETMQENGIRSTLLRHEVFEEMRWKWLGGLKQKQLKPRTSQAVYTHCALKGCYTLANGEFTVCPRGITTESVFKAPKNFWEHVKIRSLPCNVFGRARLAVSLEPRIYKDYCRYCLGVSKLNPFSVAPGTQLKRRKGKRSWKK
ncbi:MAG: radical SAM protein [Lachnospiraceae bacterium]|nr:radical SAM protein [Lachnospiraceae bacterium]